MLRTPRRGALGRPSAVAQQELVEPAASPQLIALGSEPGPHQVPQCLMRRVRHPHRCQIPRPGRLPRTSPQARSTASTVRSPSDPRRSTPAAARACRADQPPDRLGPVQDRPETSYLTAWFRYCHRNRLRTDIQANKSYVLHRRLPFVCGSAPRFDDPIRSVIRDAANREPLVP
jgi:hypothetical protein